MTRISSWWRAPVILSPRGRRCSASARAQHLVVSITADPVSASSTTRWRSRGSPVASRSPCRISPRHLRRWRKPILIAAMPRRFVAMHAARFAVVSRELPLRLRTFSIQAVVPKVALMDAGLAWLFDVLGEAAQGGAGAKVRAPGAGSRRVMSGLVQDFEPVLLAGLDVVRRRPGRSPPAPSQRPIRRPIPRRASRRRQPMMPTGSSRFAAR